MITKVYEETKGREKDGGEVNGGRGLRFVFKVIQNFEELLGQRTKNKITSKSLEEKPRKLKQSFKSQKQSIKGKENTGTNKIRSRKHMSEIIIAADGFNYLS